MWWDDGKESIDDWILNQWPGNDGKEFGTKKQRNKVSIEYSMIIERSGMNGVCRSNDGITDWFGQDQREWKKHLWMISNQSNNQYSKLISIEHNGMNQVDRHFEDLEYLNMINIQYSEILSNVTERGSSKLYFSEVIDVRFGRSTFIHFQSFH